MGYFSKVVDDVRISYHFLNDNLPIFTRTILLLNTDSLKAINWVNSHGGIVYSPLIHEESGIIRFLILDRHSSLILTGTLTNNNFSIDFNYPDINNSIRSNNRTIDDDGNFLIEGKDNFGNKTSLSY
ncbi:hypothetical protein C9994_10340 [Marivirga lumbricoides]|uniref:Uncharacterized protein n=1 Tax=Marivirga lumbricoides TaxID=1046115 RepID=A0A2T4DPL3_9BACT|nr:hypothetical protein C9994_10340 [Marivirga lumbricoides]